MLALQGSVSISVNGSDAFLNADAGAVRIDMDGPVRFLRATGLCRRSNFSALRRLAERLSQNGLTVTIVSRGKRLVVLGHGVKSGMASALLGIPHLEIQGANLLARIKG